MSRLKGDKALFADGLNHFSDLLDKNGAALPSSLLLKGQKTYQFYFETDKKKIPFFYQCTRVR